MESVVGNDGADDCSGECAGKAAPEAASVEEVVVSAGGKPDKVLVLGGIGIGIGVAGTTAAAVLALKNQALRGQLAGALAEIANLNTASAAAKILRSFRLH